MYEFTDNDYDLLGRIAIEDDRNIKNMLIRELCSDKPLPDVRGLDNKRSSHNSRITWLNENFPGWNDPIPNYD